MFVHVCKSCIVSINMAQGSMNHFFTFYSWYMWELYNPDTNFYKGREAEYNSWLYPPELVQTLPENKNVFESSPVLWLLI